MNLHSMDIKEVYEKLNTSDKGLSGSEVNKRLEEYGKNELPKEKKAGIAKVFFSQFKSSIVYIMILAAIFSFLLKEYVDTIAIIIIILVDAILGTLQEWKAGKEAESLQNLIKVQTKVLRDNKEMMIDSEDLVIGDVVLLESGNKVSADLRIIESSNLTIDESVLTGESIAATKSNTTLKENISIVERKNIAYAGTSVTTGRAVGIVIAVGVDTEVGKISSKVLETKSEETPLVIRMEKLTKQISILILVIAAVLIVILLLKGEQLGEILLSVTALSVSAMPEGLPLALTLALTIGSNRMGKKNVVVKKLNSVESLGSCTVIASDKTGTLTVNEQTAQRIVLADGSTYEVTGTGYNGEGEVIAIDDADINKAKEISKLGMLNNEATLKKEDNKWRSFGDSIDIAFLALGEKLKVKTNTSILGEIPYESEKKYSAVFYKEDGKNYCTAKGSVEKILEFCDSMIVDGKRVPIDKNQIKGQNEALAGDGYRIIALAKKECVEKENSYVEGDIPQLDFIGLVAFIDPIRKEAKDSVGKCKKAGIKVVMITGDHPLTAFAISKELGIASNYDEVTTGTEIEEYLAKGNKAFDNFVKEKRVFSRVTPIQKLEIVNSFKRQGEFIAVTGDGVNDAPAIKAANIGVAMGSGTDVAKETGTMIIIDDNFMSIVAGIEEGRNAYSNIRKVVYMLLSTGISEVLFFTLSIVFNLPMPLMAIQLLWLNIVTDGFQDIALSFEKEDGKIMKEKPRDPKESVFDRLMTQETLLAGFSIGLIVFSVWIYLLKVLNMDAANARGYVMLLMVFMQNIQVINCRSEKKSAFKIPLSNNWFVVASITAAIILQIIVMEVPIFNTFLQVDGMPILDIILIFLVSLPVLFIMEIFKKIKFKED